jgi:ribosomal protein S18 acetylase RimI-like enzyme
MTIRIRHARLEPPGSGVRDDAAAVLDLVRALAVAQDAGHHVTATADDLRRDGTGPAPRFRAMLAEGPDGAAVGLALYYFTYSTWTGRSKLYVEDLYVDAALRGSGLGRRLMAALARTALDAGAERLDLSVKTDNAARAFYERLGLTRSGTWLPYAVGGSDLRDLAASADGSTS